MALLFLSLAFLLVIARLTAWLSLRVGLPSMVGALIAGVLLSPGLLNFYGSVPESVNTILSAFAEIGFLLLVFSAGLELDLRDLRRWGRAVIASAWLGAALTLAVITPIMLAAGYEMGIALFTAVALAGTGNGVAAQMVIEMNMTRMRVGVALLYAAMIDDVVVLFVLSALVIVVSNPIFGAVDILVIALRFGLFILIGMAVGWKALPPLLRWAVRFDSQIGATAVAFAALFAFAWAAEVFGGMATITGAFIAGLCIARSEAEVVERLRSDLNTLGAALFLPLFFIHLGIRADVRALDASTFELIGVLLIASILTKLIGCGLGARWGGFDARSALHLAVGMVPRGAVGLALTGVGMRYGLMTDRLFPQIVIVILGTTILAPPFVRRLNRSVPPTEAALDAP